MPLYEYGCDSCQQVHEVMQKFADEPLKECPSCGSPVRKLMSRSSFALKGTGWYTSDYKRSNSSSGTCPNGAPKPPGGCCSGGCAH